LTRGAGQAAVAGLKTWRSNTHRLLAVALLAGVRFWPARLGAVVCLALLRLYAGIERQFRVGGYEHWQNQ
jgi:hypothetical protein